MCLSYEAMFIVYNNVYSVVYDAPSETHQSRMFYYNKVNRLNHLHTFYIIWSFHIDADLIYI